MATQSKKPKDPYAVAVGKRLRLAREKVREEYAGRGGLRRFADDTGIDEDNLGNWERGVSLVDQLYVKRLKTLFGINFEWIYDGDASTLRPDLSIALLTKDRRKE